MGGERVSSYLAAVALLMLVGGPLSAQQGAIAGRVTNATTLAPVPQARISVVAGGGDVETISESDGSFELRLDEGLYDLLVEASDFAPTRFDRIRVSAGQTTARNLALESRGYRLAGFIVTASRVTAPRGSSDTEITAPSSSHSVSSLEITERPAVSPVEHLRESPGVDVATQGLQSSNVVVRGFNNIFSGALHMLTDNRLAGVPVLRVNLMHFLPLNDDDIDRVEVVLGPGAALYGPNTANGVVHVITKSPLESQGTTVTLGAGERSVLQSTFRSAFLITDDFGMKVSGQVLRGEEWPYVDSREQSQRDYGIRRYGLEARADWRYSRRGTVVATYGRTDASGIELTPLTAVQAKDWIYEFVQARLTYDRWFVQAYVNANDAGETFLLRDGTPLVDRSTLGVVQVQNSFGLADGRFDFTYGWDYFSTQPKSDGRIYGDYEGDNRVKEWGVYLESKVALSSKVDLIAAGRIDSHSILPAKVFSPRLALVVKPDEHNAIRFAYNRAFSTPTALNYFLDIGAGLAPDSVLAGLGYTTRAFGTGRNGFAWLNPDGSLRGMRSPFNPGEGGPGELLSVDQSELWRLYLAGAADTTSPLALSPEILAVLQGLGPPGDSDVDILYRPPQGSAGPLADLHQVLSDVPPIKESSTETFEAGWSGVLASSLRLSADVYYVRQHDFVSPLTPENPFFLFLDQAGLETWLGQAYVPARAQDLVSRLGLSMDAATDSATAEAGTLASGIGRTPLAIVSSDVPQMENGGADVILTYRNVGVLDLWGADFTLRWSLNPEWTLSATYSHVSQNRFDIGGGDHIALNAPADKATLGLGYRNEGWGLNASARVRYTAAFPVDATADFTGVVDDYALVDMTVGYEVPRTKATLQLGVTNVLNTGYRSFVGVPTTGRLAMARLRYDLF